MTTDTIKSLKALKEGAQLYKQEKYFKASKCFMMAINNNAENTGAWAGLILSFAHLDKWHGVDKAYEKAIATNQQNILTLKKIFPIFVQKKRREGES